MGQWAKKILKEDVHFHDHPSRAECEGAGIWYGSEWLCSCGQTFAFWATGWQVC